jgi:hypothetical protein
MNRQQKIDWWADMLSEQMQEHGIQHTAEQARALAIDVSDCKDSGDTAFDAGPCAFPSPAAPKAKAAYVPRAGACTVWCGQDFNRSGFVIDINERDQVALVTFPQYPSVPDSWERFDRIS